MEKSDNLLLKNTNEENSKKKFDKRNLLIIFILIFIIIPIILIIYFTKNGKRPFPSDITIDFNFSLINNNSQQNVLVYWNCSENFDLVSIKVIGLQNENIRIYNFKKTTEGEALVQIYYGIPKIHIYYEKGKYASDKYFAFNVPIDEICIAPLVASMPVTLLSFEVFNITKKYNCPIYVYLERYLTWNWDSLPNNVYLIDFIDQKKFRNLDFMTIYYSFGQWIAQLYKVNNNIKIHLFLNDFHFQVFSLYIFSNNIPEKNYDLTLMSDGSASYFYFNKYFDNNETYLANYEKMSIKWKNHKKLIWDLKKYNDKIDDSRFIKRDELCYYCYVVVKEEKNVFWWLTKIKGLFAPNNPKMLEELLNNDHIVLKEINYLLSSLNESEKFQMKQLFNFNENYFEEAVKSNKLIMVIAGTYQPEENNLYDYCRALKKFYGDEYFYYYKGHPHSPTENYPDKQKELKKINVIPIDSSIPLEIIYFFNQDIFFSGYYTSSFIEIKNDTLKGLLDQTKIDNIYYNKFDFFAKYTSKDNSKYKKYLGGKDRIVIEINKDKLINFGYDFGIYIKDNNIINYYNY